MSIFRITNEQIVNGKIPSELLSLISSDIEILDLFGCRNLITLPPLPPSLQKLNLSDCASLTTLPPLPQGLKSLILRNCTSLTTLPPLPQVLKELNLRNWTSLTTLPDLPPSLQILDLSCCASLTTLPDLPPSLQILNLSDCTSLTTLPNLPTSLQGLYLCNCISLTILPILPPRLQNLNLSNCTSLTTLSSLPQGLKYLNLSFYRRLTTLPDLPPSLKYLDLRNCTSLTTLPNLPQSLKELNLSDCSSLTTLPPLPPSFQKIDFFNCTSLITLPDLPQNIQELDLRYCSSLTTLPDLPQNLQELNLRDCRSLTTLPNLPSGLIELNLSDCSSLTTLPDLPSNIENIDLSGCNQLSPASIAKLEALEEANQHNPRFRIIWPQGLSRNDKLLDKLKDAYRQYHSTNPDFVGREPNIFDQINYPTLFLFHRFTSESLGTRGKREVIASALSVAQDIYNNPKILEILDKKSSNYLTACVNQPVCGFAEIATLIDISKQDNITAKIQKAKILRVQQLIKNNIRFLRNQSDRTVGVEVEVELGNAILREVHKKLLSEEIISQPWQGIPGNISYETTIQSFLTKDNIEKMFNLAQDALAETPQCKKDTTDFLCVVETDFWANTILTKEELEADNERIEKLKAKILEIDPSESHLITKIQQEINAIQRVKSANLVTTLQQKTKDLLREQDSSKVRASISPSPIEPEITLTTSQENDSAGGVFNERSKLKQSLYNRLKLRSNGIELSGDVVILTQENSEEPHRELNQQPSPFVNTTSGLTESQAQPITKQNHHYKD